jgi:quercetin dioxygenase-like cupin family protein
MDLDKYFRYGNLVEFVDNVFVKLVPLMPEQSQPTHAHHFDHITLLAIGTVKLRREDQKEEDAEVIKAPNLRGTKAGKMHQFTNVSTTDPAILCCIHAIRNGDGVEDVAEQDISREEAIKLINTYTMDIKNSPNLSLISGAVDE